MKHHLVLRVVTKFMLPPILLFAFYVQFHGDFGPGGGFQAGVIFAAGVILYALVFGMESARAAIPMGALRLALPLGVLLYSGVGVWSLFFGQAYLDHDVFGARGHEGQHLGILLVEAGVGITVASVMIAIFYAFGARAPKLSDRDW